MKKIYLRIRIYIFLALCAAFFIAFFCMCGKSGRVEAENDPIVLNVWQIDSFEGGKGSRADYLQDIGSEFGASNNCYVSVVSLTADAARLNLSRGNVPDLISYGAGTYGIESYISDANVWCRGGYCLLTLNTEADFSDASGDNTVINRGKDNFSALAALFCGLNGGKSESATSAYVKLIAGEYKYLLGTQRDVFRLKTRKVAFSIKPITEFNDLYQSISITASCKNRGCAQKYIDFLLSKSGALSKIGLMSDRVKLYGDSEMKVMEGIAFRHRITYPINAEAKERIEKSIASGDINMLKELLK